MLLQEGHPYSHSDLDLACDAAVRVVSVRGPDALSVRAIAGEMGLTGPALTHRWDNKARLWGLLVHRLGDRWLRHVDGCVRDAGPAGFLAAATRDVDATRVWLCFTDLGRADPLLSARLADVVDRERGLLRVELETVAGDMPPGQVVDGVHATATGLRERVCSVAVPMDVSRATEVWDTTWRRATGRRGTGPQSS